LGLPSFQIVQQLEAVNQVKEPLKSDLINGKWELLYTTSTTILQPQVPILFVSNLLVFLYIA